MMSPPADAPRFEIVNGGATAEEIAALTAVLAASAAAAAGRRRAGAAASGAAASGAAGSPGWADRSRLLREPLAHAPGGWRASARPK